MPVTKEFKQEIISKFATFQQDTGSSLVQIALFTKYITNLTEHLKVNRNDFQARRSLLTFVTRRKRLLLYLKRHNTNEYERIIKELKLKKV